MFFLPIKLMWMQRVILSSDYVPRLCHQYMTREPRCPILCKNWSALWTTDLYGACSLQPSGNSAIGFDARFDRYTVVNPTCLRSCQGLSETKQVCAVLKQGRMVLGLLRATQGTVKYPPATLIAYKGNSKTIQARCWWTQRGRKEKLFYKCVLGNYTPVIHRGPPLPGRWWK